jgi:hypothetical protein
MGYGPSMASKKLRYLHEYAISFARLGEAGFLLEYGGTPVLVGEGISGELQDRLFSSAKVDIHQTFTIQPIDPNGFSSEAMKGRVFTLEPNPDSSQGSNPDSSHGAMIVVGRWNNEDVMLPDHSVSRRHCGFLLGPEGVSVMDLGSKNGTEVDDRVLSKDESCPLEGGELITIGRLCLRFSTGVQFARLLKGLLNGI